MMKSRRPSSYSDQYELTSRLSTPRTRGRSAQNQTSPHSPLCDHDCPIWHVSPSVRNAIVSPRILHLANPKHNHPNFTSNRQNVQTLISYAAQTARMTSRLQQLSLPRVRENTHFCEPGPPESPITPVSRGARKATASARIRSLSTPKALSKDYVPPRDPMWRS
ncbi:testicular haploid expressed gene protein-like [Danio aesculapii]|uniref:testicular haploid expressed gene protein-like n=1 Tax=Danio aesculapii TaxID=1142201 RepID=UPI0024BF8F0B|nr:testicular haploid expressed gene protein-like [Danio aesculapii]